MRMVGLALLLAWTVAGAFAEQAWAWGQEGHSIVAEIAAVTRGKSR